MTNLELNIFGSQKILTQLELKRVFEVVLKSLNINKAKINLIFTSENKIRELNNKFRNIDSATDVLTFPYNDDDCTGEIIISILRIQKQAKEYKIETKEELNKIFIHGLLHLFSFDHIKKKDQTIMEKKERELLKIIQKI